MHNTHTGDFLFALAREARETKSDAVFSVLAGAICHYCLDRTAHPYIICKGGGFDGSKETRAFRGGHVRLERAIDSYFIRQTYGMTPWKFSIPQQIMKLKAYPEILRASLDRAYADAKTFIHRAHCFVYDVDCDALNTRGMQDNLFENSNYSTGFLCEDPRNETAPAYEPLPFSEKF